MSAISKAAFLFSSNPILAIASSFGCNISVFAFLCNPKEAFNPSILLNASLSLSSVITPFLYPSIIHWKSSSGSLKNKNKSLPAAIAVGNISLRFIAEVIATIWDASVTTKPLNPIWPFNKSVNTYLLKVAGIFISWIVASGLNFFTYCGKAICPAIIDGRPASIKPEYTFPKVLSHSSTVKVFGANDKCWSLSSIPSPGKCLAAGKIPDSIIPFIYCKDNSKVCSTSADQVLVDIIGFLQFLFISTIGAKLQLHPIADASIPDILPNS